MQLAVWLTLGGISNCISTVEQSAAVQVSDTTMMQQVATAGKINGISTASYKRMALQDIFENF